MRFSPYANSYRKPGSRGNSHLYICNNHSFNNASLQKSNLLLIWSLFKILLCNLSQKIHSFFLYPVERHKKSGFSKIPFSLFLWGWWLNKEFCNWRPSCDCGKKIIKMSECEKKNIEHSVVIQYIPWFLWHYYSEVNRNEQESDRTCLIQLKSHRNADVLSSSVPTIYLCEC